MVIAHANPVEIPPLNLSTLKITPEQFQDLCIANPDRPLELTAQGIIVTVQMS